MSGIGSRKDGKTNGTKQRARKQKIPPQGRDFLIGESLLFLVEIFCLF